MAPETAPAGVVQLVADENLSVTYASRAAGERVTGLHVHQHAEAFYVLEGELTFQVGAERETITIGAGGLVAAPPGLAHGYGTAGDRPARWLVIHAPDGGFAEFMRGIRDGVQIDWDIAPVPADGGLPADRAIISRPLSALRSRPESPRDRARERSRAAVLDGREDGPLREDLSLRAFGRKTCTRG